MQCVVAAGFLILMISPELTASGSSVNVTDYHMSDIYGLHSLNAATASLKTTTQPMKRVEPEYMTLSFTATVMAISTILAMVYALFKAILYTQYPLPYTKSLIQYVDMIDMMGRNFAAHFLIYAFSGRSRMSLKPYPKDVTSFSMDILGARRKSSCCLDSTLMATMLEKPTMDHPSGIPRSPAKAFGKAICDRVLEQSNAHETKLQRYAARVDPDIECPAADGQNADKKRRRPGGKPKFSSLRDADLSREASTECILGSPSSSISHYASGYDSCDSDWEIEPRSLAPITGRPMDGIDVGCPPDRVLRLPVSMVRQAPLPIDGRSILFVEGGIPPPKSVTSSRGKRNVPDSLRRKQISSN